MAVSGGRSGDGDELLREALVVGGAGKAEAEDLEEMGSVEVFLLRAAEENRRLWYLAGPAIFTSLAQYSLGAVTQVFAGHVTTLDLDAVSTENSVIAGLAFGIMEDGMEMDVDAPAPSSQISIKPGLPEIEIYCYLLVLIFLIDQKKYGEAKACATASICSFEELESKNC